MDRVPSGTQRVLFEGVSRASSAALPQFLQQQRWFGSKARAIESVELLDGVWLDERFLLAFVRVAFQKGEGETYSLLFKVAPDLEGTHVLGTFRDSGRDFKFGEASSEVGAATALIEALCREGDLCGVSEGVLRAGDAETKRLEELIAQGLGVQPLGAEQSNTSFRIGRDFVYKLFRKLQHGENPELEMSRYLWRKTTFRAMPGLRGWQTMRFAGGEEATVGILQDWVANEGDGWSYLVRSLREETEQSEPALSRDMSRLGQITAEFHWALAGAAMEPGFAPEPVTQSDVSRWVTLQREQVNDVFRQLAQSKPEVFDSVVFGSVGDLWDSVQGGRDLLTDGRELSCSGDHGFQKIRVHGDFHLGQTLKTEGNFVLFDFEGEPARSLEARRAKTSALKDVAGLLRSLEYAVAYARPSDASSRGAPHGDKAEHLRTAFLSGYLSTTFEHEAPFLPSSRSALDSWLDFFELDKVVYELGYELNNRPDWIWIPLEGAARLIARRRG